MRNLLGRLHARSVDELARIAAAWQVPLPSGDRLSLVSRLYRALSDPRTARDCWAHLPDDERAMVRLLAVSEETALSLPDLAGHLDLTEEETRQIAVRLYHKAIVVREGDDEPLPVGVLPRLFLPRELTLLFRRVQDEIDTGDISQTPLRALLALLDDRELEESAEVWGVTVVPGLRGRDDVTRQLLQRVGDADRVASVVEKRRREAALIWRRVLEAEDSVPVPLEEAASAAGLTTSDPRGAQRLREALAELERALLVWHTYRSDGSRWLFIPSEIRAPRPAKPAGAPALNPTLVPPTDIVPWHPDDALAWDLLTFLRALSAPGAPRVQAAADLPRSWRQRLNRGLWWRGNEVPPVGYLEFLVALAQREGLLVGGAEIGHDPLTVSADIREWRNRSFAEQSARLQRHWLAHPSWIEGDAREDVDVWGAEWIPFRRKLLIYLAELPLETWYGMDDLAAWLAARDPDMLGATFTVATARRVEPAESDTARRQSAIAEVAAVTLDTSVRWFGLVTVATAGRRDRLVTVTPRGQALASGQSPPEAPSTDGSALTVTSTGEVELRHPSPLRVWSLSAFADLVALDRVSLYRLTEESVGRALRAGFEARQIMQFLSAQSGNAVPDELSTEIERWSRGFRRVRLRSAVVVTPDDPENLPEMQARLVERGLIARLVDGSLLITLSGVPEDAAALAVQTALREDGFSPQWDARSPANAVKPPKRT